LIENCELVVMYKVVYFCLYSVIVSMTMVLLLSAFVVASSFSDIMFYTCYCFPFSSAPSLVLIVLTFLQLYAYNTVVVSRRRTAASASR
jgi:hypothetical protein